MESCEQERDTGCLFVIYYPIDFFFVAKYIVIDVLTFLIPNSDEKLI